MKEFLNRHVLFPKKYGAMPYYYLLFLFFAVFAALPIKNWFDWFCFLALIPFAKFYRDSYGEEIPNYDWEITAMIAIAALWVLNYQYYYNFIFAGFCIGFSEIKPHIFKNRVVIYLSAVTACAVYTVIKQGFDINLFFGLLFAYSCVFFAHSFAVSQRKRFVLKQDNERLSIIIKQSERDRIAGQLHDNLGQVFSTLAINADLAEKLVDKNPDLAKKQIQQIGKNARDNLSLVREIVADLRKQKLVQVLAVESENLENAKFDLTTENQAQAFTWPDNIQNELSFIIREAIANAIRYSKGNLVRITFNEDSNNYFVRIKDNGIGFKNKANTSREHFGISGMQTRTEKLKGSFAISDKNGVEISISIPKE